MRAAGGGTVPLLGATTREPLLARIGLLTGLFMKPVHTRPLTLRPAPSGSHCPACERSNAAADIAVHGFSSRVIFAIDD